MMNNGLLILENQQIGYMKPMWKKKVSRLKIFQCFLLQNVVTKELLNIL